MVIKSRKYLGNGGSVSEPGLVSGPITPIAQYETSHSST